MMIFWDNNKAAFTGAHRYLIQGVSFGSRHSKGVSIVWTRRGKIFQYVAANWTPNAVFKLESTMRAAAGLARVRLENITDSIPVTGSELSTGSAVEDVYQSGTLSLTDGKKYQGATGQQAGDDGKSKGVNILALI